MNSLEMIENARKYLHRAEDSLKYYALSGGMDLDEYSRLLHVAQSARQAFLERVAGKQLSFDFHNADELRRAA